MSGDGRTGLLLHLFNRGKLGDNYKTATTHQVIRKFPSQFLHASTRVHEDECDGFACVATLISCLDRQDLSDTLPRALTGVHTLAQRARIFGPS